MQIGLTQLSAISYLKRVNLGWEFIFKCVSPDWIPAPAFAGMAGEWAGMAGEWVGMTKGFADGMEGLSERMHRWQIFGRGSIILYILR